MPSGSLRYRTPARRQSWDGVRDAIEFGPSAPQHRPDGTLGQIFAPAVGWGEDCLRLNVWTPEPANSGKLPVLVWIHGGGFLFGTGAMPMLDRAAFARDGLVVVSINYRLGIDGFLYRRDDPEGGNYGLLDQVAALRWVQENIAAFGGDPARVTVAGNSAGATAVGALLVAPVARGLFQRAIIQSGYPDPLLSAPSAEITAHEVYDRAGLGPGDIDGLRDIRERSPEKVLAIQKSLFDEVVRTRDAERFGQEIAVTGNPFQPVVGTGVVPGRPVDELAHSSAPGVDLLIGHTTEEYRLMYGIGLLGSDLGLDAVEEAFHNALPGAGASAFAMYRARMPDAGPVELLAALDTDRGYRAPAVKVADAHALGAKTYFYRFAWQSAAFGGVIGAGHSVETPFVFDALGDQRSLQLTGPEPPQELADDIHGAWLRFVTQGDPNHPGLPFWPFYRPADRAMLEFSRAHRVVRDPDPETLRLWLASHANVG